MRTLKLLLGGGGGLQHSRAVTSVLAMKTGLIQFEGGDLKAVKHHQQSARLLKPEMHTP